MKITKELIEKVQTPIGGYTGETLKILTGVTQPSKGWKERIIGKEISDDSFVFTKVINHDFFG